MVDDQIADGMYGYDIGQVPPQPVLITDADKGRVGDLKRSLRELVLDSPGNQAMRVSEDSETIGVQYIEIDGSTGQEYTMPADRIATPQVEVETEAGRFLPHQYNAYLTLKALFAEAARADEDFLLEIVGVTKQTSIDSVVVDAAHEAVSDGE